MNKPYFFQHFYLVNWRNKRLKNTIDLLLFYREHFYGFLKVFWRCLEDAFARHLEDVLKVSLRSLEKLSWRCLKNVFARRLEDILKTSWRSLEDVWPRQIYWPSSKRIEDALKPPSEDEDETRLQDVSKTSWLRQMFAGVLHNSSCWKSPLYVKIFTTHI